MLRTTMKALLLGLSLCVCMSAFGAPQQSSLAAPRTIATDSLAPRTVGESLITSMSDFQGSLLSIEGGKNLQILELILGANEQWHLTAAYIKVLDEHGEVVEVDRRENCRAVFSTLEDARGFYLRFPGTPEVLWVEEIQFGRLPDGHLTRLGVQAVNAEGMAVGSLAPLAQAVPACACQWFYECRENTCLPPATCGPPPTCACSKAGQACASTLVCQCPPNGLCTAPQKCKAKLVQVPVEGTANRETADQATCECQ